MFQGATALSLDAKGRLAVPARHRDGLLAAAAATAGGESATPATLATLVLTAHPHGCLLLYPLPAWEPIRDKILKAPSFDTRAQALKRVLVGNAREDSLDSAGRLLVAPELRDHARLEKTVWLVGMGSHFEIWSDDGWKRQNAVALEALQGDTPPAGFEDISL